MVYPIKGFAKVNHGGTIQLPIVICPSPDICHGAKYVLGCMVGSESKLTLVQDGVLLEAVVQLPINNLLKNCDNYWYKRDGTMEQHTIELQVGVSLQGYWLGVSKR